MGLERKGVRGMQRLALCPGMEEESRAKDAGRDKDTVGASRRQAGLMAP